MKKEVRVGIVFGNIGGFWLGNWEGVLGGFLGWWKWFIFWFRYELFEI